MNSRLLVCFGVLVLGLLVGCGNAIAQASPPDVFATLCKTGTVQQVREAIVAGADVNAKNDKDMTPLMFAAAKNPNPEVIAALVKAGAGVNAKNTEGRTPLSLAAWNNPSPEVIAALMKAGADVNAKRGTIGLTPLMCAALMSPKPEVISALVKAGADVNAKDAEGKSVLEYGRESKNAAVVAELIKAGAK